MKALQFNLLQNTIHPVVSLHELTPAEILATWFSVAECAAIKRTAAQAVPHARGLEQLAEDEAWKSYKARQFVYDVILGEQEKRKRRNHVPVCWAKLYGQQSVHCSKAALARAKSDHLDAKECYAAHPLPSWTSKKSNNNNSSSIHKRLKRSSKPLIIPTDAQSCSSGESMPKPGIRDSVVLSREAAQQLASELENDEAQLNFHDSLDLAKTRPGIRDSVILNQNVAKELAHEIEGGIQDSMVMSRQAAQQLASDLDTTTRKLTSRPISRPRMEPNKQENKSSIEEEQEAPPSPRSISKPRMRKKEEKAKNSSTHRRTSLSKLRQPSLEVPATKSTKVRFNTTNRVRTIGTLANMTESERNSVWYSPEECDIMIRKAQKRAAIADEQGDPVGRGLEIFTRAGNKAIKKARKRASKIVLGSKYDAEKVALMYRVEATKCKAEAITRAKQDAKEVRKHQDKEKGRSITPLGVAPTSTEILAHEKRKKPFAEKMVVKERKAKKEGKKDAKSKTTVSTDRTRKVMRSSVKPVSVPKTTSKQTNTKPATPKLSLREDRPSTPVQKPRHVRNSLFRNSTDIVNTAPQCPLEAARESRRKNLALVTHAAPGKCLVNLRQTRLVDKTKLLQDEVKRRTAHSFAGQQATTISQ